MEFEIPKTATELFGMEIDDDHEAKTRNQEERYYTIAQFLGAELAQKLEIDQREGDRITHYVVFTFDRENDHKAVSYEIEELTYNALVRWME